MITALFILLGATLVALFGVLFYILHLWGTEMDKMIANQKRRGS